MNTQNTVRGLAFIAFAVALTFTPAVYAVLALA